MQLVDESGSVVRDDVLIQGEWVAAGETLTFTGAMWYLNTEDTLDSAFDVRISHRMDIFAPPAVIPRI